MAGLIDLLSPAVNVATGAAGAYQGAEAQASKEKIQAAIDNLMLQRQAEQQRIKDTLMQSQTGEAQARIADMISQRQNQHQQMLLNAVRNGLVPVAPDDPGSPGGGSVVPLPTAPRYQIGDDTFQYDAQLDPYTRKLPGMLAAIDARGDQARLTRQTVPGGSLAAQTGSGSRANYILRRVPTLTKTPTFHGVPSGPGISLDSATAQAGHEWDAAHGVTGDAPTSADPLPAARPPLGGGSGVSGGNGITLADPTSSPSGSPSSMSPSVLQAHQQIDANAARAIQAGADPQQVMERANHLHAQVGAP